MWTHDARDPFEFFSCTMTVESEGNMETRLLRGPRIFLEEQILDEIKGMYTKGAKGRVTVTRPKKTLTRVGQHAKVVVIGHEAQCDLDAPETSGFMRYIRHFEGQPRTAICHLTQNYRGWISRWADELSEDP